MKQQTIATALQFGYEKLGSSTNDRLKAELLLTHLLKVSRAYLFTHKEKTIADSLWAQFLTLCGRCAQGEPIAYLLGQKEFWSIEFEVNSHTLIPRPETELLVSMTLEKLPPSSNITIADLGVGSGAVAIALALERPQWRIYGTDISQDALDVAKRNVSKHHVQNIILLKSNWCVGLPREYFDAIVSNPPYIAEKDPHLQELTFEPLNALISGKDGLDAIRTIISQAKNNLKKDGLLLLEHGYDQAAKVRKLLAQENYTQIVSYRDLSGIERVTTGTNQG